MERRVVLLLKGRLTKFRIDQIHVVLQKGYVLNVKQVRSV